MYSSHNGLLDHADYKCHKGYKFHVCKYFNHHSSEAGQIKYSGHADHICHTENPGHTGNFEMHVFQVIYVMGVKQVM